VSKRNIVEDVNSDGEGDRDSLPAECLSSAELDSFLAESLDSEELRRVESHIEWCTQCAAELEAHYESDFDESRSADDNRELLARLGAELFGAPPPGIAAASTTTPPSAIRAELAAKLWKALEGISVTVPFRLRVARTRSTLAAATAPQQAGSAFDGNVRWSFAARSTGVVIELRTKWGALVGVRIQLSIDGVPISGRGGMPELELLPEQDGDLAVHAELRVEHLQAFQDELAVEARNWQIRLGPVDPAS
jgi:hypothetical protein